MALAHIMNYFVYEKTPANTLYQMTDIFILSSERINIKRNEYNFLIDIANLKFRT